MIIALILGRKGSIGFPGKNTYPVMGKPLAYYPMKTALDSPYVDRVYLSTNDENLIKLAEEQRVEVIIRPPELCTKEALGEDAFVHGYRHIKNKLDKEIEFMVLLFCNAATVSGDLIKQGIEILRSDPSLDSAVSVSCYNMWSPLRARKIGKDGLLHPFVPFETFGDPKALNCDRDSQGDVWFADMGVSVVRARCLEDLEHGMLPQKWMGKKIYPIKNEAGLDVDYEWQIPMVKYWLEKNLKIGNE